YRRSHERSNAFHKSTFCEDLTEVVFAGNAANDVAPGVDEEYAIAFYVGNGAKLIMMDDLTMRDDLQGGVTQRWRRQNGGPHNRCLCQPGAVVLIKSDRRITLRALVRAKDGHDVTQDEKSRTEPEFDEAWDKANAAIAPGLATTELSIEERNHPDVLGV